MMILSRVWYLILAILLAGAYYIVALAVGQYNRRNQAALEETLKADSQVVSWALQVDARRRLDTLLGPAYDANIVKAIFWNIAVALVAERFATFERFASLASLLGFGVARVFLLVAMRRM